MKSFVLLLLCGTAAAIAQSDPTPRAENSAFPARLSDVEGSVRIAQLRRPNGKPQTEAPTPDSAFHAAMVNTPVLAGTQVSTGDDGRAEIEFNDGDIARITPNSSVEVVALPTGGEEVRALRGLTYFETPDGSTGEMIVHAGPDAVKLATASLVRFDLDQAPLKVAVLKGAGHFASGQGSMEFDAHNGQTAEIDPGAPDSYNVNDEIADQSWDNWNGDRDHTLAELAQSQTEARAGTGDPSSPGWNDLDYYGTWYDVPGAGMAWAPDGVDQNFDPYGAGAWSYYSGVGYTWVSAYPWGWLPYHAGAWSYFPGFGWGWQPNGGGYNGVGWYPYTGVASRPANYRLPLPMDARLRTRLTGAPLPPPTALRGNPVAVNRAPRYGFRSLGGSRPEPRQFPVANTGGNGAGPSFAPRVAVIQPGRAAYQAGTQGGTAFRGQPGVVAPVNPGFNTGAGGQRIYQGQRVITPGPNVITPPPSVVPSTPRVLTPSPRAIAPPPRVVTPVAPPPARVAPPAPVIAVPAGPRGPR